MNGIKSGIPKKNFRIDQRMFPEEILSYRDQRFGICKTFILIGRTGFLFCNDVRIGFDKLFIVERNIPDNARSVCNDAEFKGFQLLDDIVDVLGIIFSNPGLNAGSVKEHHGRFVMINPLADWFGQADKVIGHDCKFDKKFCLNRVNLEASGTTSNPQKSRNS